MKARSFAPLLAVVLLGCKTTAPSTTTASASATTASASRMIDPPHDPAVPPQTNVAAPADEKHTGDSKTLLSAADRTAVVKGEQLFASRLYAKLPRGGNIAFSPASLRIALGMAYEGARGDTATEMQKVLAFGDRDPTRAGLVGELAAFKEANAAGGQKLYVANRLWGAKGRPWRAEFLGVLERDYGAGLGQLDFAADPSGSRAAINTFIDQATEQMIADVIPPNAIRKDTAFVITNAVYFKGLWSTPFEKGTADDEFFVSPKKSVHLPLMHVQHPLAYAKVDGYKLVELPYQGGNSSMILAVPDERFALGGDDERPPGDVVESWLGALHDAQHDGQPVQVLAPRFKVGSSFSLKGALSAMGMAHAFGREADLSGMDGTHVLFIDEVLQKARVDVDEKGTEAAAATAVMGRRPMAVRRPQEPIVVRADHPFLFMIRDVRSGSVLFMGRVVDPT